MTHAMLLLFLSWLMQTGTSVPADTKPLPELESFLQSIRKNLHSDRILQSRYTYTEKGIYRQLDSSGKVKNTETREYEVYPSIEERLTYRKLIVKNGKPLSAEEIEKHGRDYDKKREEYERKLERENVDKKHRREMKEAEADKKEEEALDDAFRLYKIAMTGREQMEGIPAIALTFDPRTEYKPRTKDGKMFAKVRGKAWFGEADQELVRLEVELIDNLSFGLGVIAKINKGTRIVFQRRRVNNEIWLPAVAHVTGTGRILLFKGFRIDQEIFYSDYHKFSVETDIKFSSEKKP